MDNDEEIQKIRQELKDKRKNKSNNDIKVFKPISSRHAVRKISTKSRKKPSVNSLERNKKEKNEDPQLVKALDTFTSASDEKESIMTKDEVLNEYEKFRAMVPKGGMKKSELEKALLIRKNLFIDSSDLDEQIEAIFRVFGKEEPHSLLFDEYILALKTLEGNTPKDKLKWIFKVYDKSEMGFIEVDELTKMMGVLCNMSGYNISNNDLKDLCEHVHGILDTDGDGHVDESEFIEGILSSPMMLNILCPEES